MKSQSLALFLLAALTIAGCSGEEPSGGASAPSSGAAAPTNRIDIPPTVRSNLGLTFAKVERRWVASTIRVPGAFELQPLARREHRLTLPGHVRLEVDQYQPVAAGDVLYRFRSPEWPELQHEIIEGEQAIDSARAAIEVARSRVAEAEQRRSILRSRLASFAQAEVRSAELEAAAAEIDASLPRLRAELRQAETMLANAERTREHAIHRASVATGVPEERLAAEVGRDGRVVPAYRTIDWIEVRAAAPGVVETIALTDGAFAEATALVLSVIDPERVRFRAMALQSDLLRLLEATETRIVPPDAQGAAVGDAVEASLTVGLEAHPEQRTVTLLATPAGTRAWTRPGVSAFLEVVVRSSDGPALAIPRSAVVKDGIVHVFFRRDPADPNKAIRVEADMGVSDGRWVAIKSGLALNDEVVLDGAYELKLASQLSGARQQGGHFHADGTFHGDH